MAKHVALIGKSRSGKDTVGQMLVRHAGYTRLAFADELKRAALRLDPYIPLAPARVSVRLSDLIRRVGWETAKDQFPEVRRVLQEYGQSVRELEPEFWVRPVVGQVRQGTEWNMPCVITDARYLNEVDAIRAEGGVIVRVERPGAGLQGEAARHSSETELDGLEPDHVLRNDGGLVDLLEATRALYRQIGS
ncbi:deoxynucleoside monophosphate kinase [Streptomyces phage Attoomi]|uniref:Deoxynucleoside monophosphate kinase n=1 Tax=Streptomyces phage Attoomi TaxID=2059881 RepID=A0A2H5BLJ7_9CAUD|nr:deoxynucleoside monophosphate kinase [Streptomyces phage Attoomi]AUG87154.1 deoxynucleoside monophosphate kinase [Streptomyces phage Attoomi]